MGKCVFVFVQPSSHVFVYLDVSCRRSCSSPCFVLYLSYTGIRGQGQTTEMALKTICQANKARWDNEDDDDDDDDRDGKDGEE